MASTGGGSCIGGGVGGGGSGIDRQPQQRWHPLTSAAAEVALSEVVGVRGFRAHMRARKARGGERERKKKKIEGLDVTGRGGAGWLG